MAQRQRSGILGRLWPKPRGVATTAAGTATAAVSGHHPLDGPPPVSLNDRLAGGNLPVLGSDWIWRPDVFSKRDDALECRNPARRRDLSAELVLYHDAETLDLSLRQSAQQGDGLPPLGLELELGGFDGGFLSLAVSLPAAAARNLELRHLIRLDLLADVATRDGHDVQVFARLNVQHGPNVEQLVSELSLHAGGAAVAVAEFDLAYGAISERRIEALWLDLIFEAPPAGVVVLRDLTLSRCPRAAL